MPVALVVNGFCKEVFKQLPLEFAIEATKLLEMKLIAGLSNREIGERLFLALDTVKGHNRRIYGKLDVKNRTQAINKGRGLNIIPSQ